jgi:hypothetical protein
LAGSEKTRNEVIRAAVLSYQKQLEREPLAILTEREFTEVEEYLKIVLGLSTF